MSAARTTVRGIGEIFITAGVVLLLFCVYQLFWTNVQADREKQQTADALHDQWANGQDPLAPVPGQTPAVAKPKRGGGFAIIRIPRLGATYAEPVVEGVTRDDLRHGVGHYPETALPGQVGNFAIAGHRATNGEPFRNLDKIRAGDKVVIETKSTWFTYVVDSPYGDSRGYEIVRPTRVDVVAAVPKHPGAAPTKRLMTLTTCHPRWASTKRLIVYTHLESQLPKSKGIPPALNFQAGG